MNLQEYQLKSRETAIYPGAGNNIVYPTLGLCGEMGELHRVIKFEESTPRLFSELSDYFWYLAQIYTELGLVLADDFPGSRHAEDDIYEMAELLAIHTNGVAEIVKKIIRDNNSIISQDRKDKLQEQLRIICHCLRDMIEDAEFKLEDILDYNIEKLFGRKERGTLHGSGENR
jgi:hypothetical protein